MRMKLGTCATILFFCILAFRSGEVWGQTAFREAVGEERATMVESLLGALVPGAKAKWSSHMAMRDAGGEERLVDFAGFTYRKRADGGSEGATGFDTGGQKEKYIFNASRFRTNGNAHFTTDFVVFRARPGGQVSDFRKFILDDSSSVSQVKAFELQEWPDDRWPILRLQYVSYYQQPGRFIAIEWQSLFDSDRGKLTERLPAGIVQSFEDGREEIHTFIAKRTNPGHLQLIDSVSKLVIDYSCEDPCIVDGSSLLKEWDRVRRPAS
jgi:hypothetical protein